MWKLSSENVRTCFQIINAYIYLSATDFLQNYAEGLCKSFCELLTDITNEGQVQVLKNLVRSAVPCSLEAGGHISCQDAAIRDKAFPFGLQLLLHWLADAHLRPQANLEHNVQSTVVREAMEC
ncbi:hypothetical protein DNTS_023688 [Danionella cerebrum]|uniref:Importin-7/11-like TPR repeats domain-containing protein n=1 Tax=Danionella cerebrum TaxID=2873325 RepID=A0A553MMK8_9TELE|nr:hypothetical protein DNTS_023688 [Danionella translucida]